MRAATIPALPLTREGWSDFAQPLMAFLGAIRCDLLRFTAIPAEARNEVRSKYSSRGQFPREISFYCDVLCLGVFYHWSDINAGSGLCSTPNASGQSIGVARRSGALEPNSDVKEQSKTCLAASRCRVLLMETALAAVGSPSDTDHEYSNSAASASEKSRCSRGKSEWSRGGFNSCSMMAGIQF